MPDNWIPLLPVQIQLDSSHVISRRQRGAVLQADDTSVLHPAQSRLLNPPTPLQLHDEDVPREGLQVTRTRRMARWIDGTAWSWSALRKQIGPGEGSSGLVFDQLHDD